MQTATVASPTVAPELSTDNPTFFSNLARTTEFWTRCFGVYIGYKATQIRAATLSAAGWSEADLEEKVWTPHHSWAGDELYNLCIDLRGFYLKVGQFLGARADFIPEPMCRRLCLLQDQVPPMPAGQARRVIQQELGGLPLEAYFEWIELDTPLGSASIAQVHKAKLREGVKGARGDRVVAVKVQYPGALEVMVQDLRNIRLAAGFLQSTELKFDLVSPVDELAKQIKIEFDFRQEAATMNSIGDALQGVMRDIRVPRSIPSLVTRRLLVMTFLVGDPITRLKDSARVSAMPALQRRFLGRQLLSKVSEAYGRMLLTRGLFQADCHPGNILVDNRGSIGLLDFGQAKQLPETERLAFARLVLALARAGDAPLWGVNQRLTLTQQADVATSIRGLGIETEGGKDSLLVLMAYGMFDTRGRINPFSKESPLRVMPVRRFPSDFFFVLRVVQLLRGMATALDLDDFSVAVQWRQLALDALAAAGQLPADADVAAGPRLPVLLWAGGVVVGGCTPGDAEWLRTLGMPSWARSWILPRAGRGTVLIGSWIYAYVAAAVACGLVLASKAVTQKAALVALLGCQLALSSAWGHILLGTRSLPTASAHGFVTLAAALTTNVLVYQAHRAAGILLLPQTLLLGAAVALTLLLWRKNPLARTGTPEAPPQPPQTLTPTPARPVEAQFPSLGTLEVSPRVIELGKPSGGNGTPGTLTRHALSEGTETLVVPSASDPAGHATSDGRPHPEERARERHRITPETLKEPPHGVPGMTASAQEGPGELVGASAGKMGASPADAARRKWKSGAGAGGGANGIGRTWPLPRKAGRTLSWPGGAGKSGGPGWRGRAGVIGGFTAVPIAGLSSGNRAAKSFGVLPPRSMQGSAALPRRLVACVRTARLQQNFMRV